MSDKQLKDKAISIKGKDYVLVSDRVTYFNDNYPNGSITTDYELVGNTYICKATVTPDIDKPERKFNGLSQATIGDGMVNKTAALENAETSAWGRALSAMGIGVIESIASADEMNKAMGSSGSLVKTLSPKSLDWIRNTAKLQLGLEHDDQIKEALGIEFPLDKLPQAKTKAAVDTLIKIAQDEKENKETVKLTQDDLDKIENGISLDDIPY